MSVQASLAEGILGLAKVVAGFMGGGEYERYRAHHEAVHSGVPPMTVREFWRDRYDAQERSPEGRCC